MHGVLKICPRKECLNCSEISVGMEMKNVVHTLEPLLNSPEVGGLVGITKKGFFAHKATIH